MDLLIIHQAEEELWNAVTYYEEQQSDLGLEFEAEVRSAFKAILLNPELWPLQSGNFRKHILPRFPYTIWYEVTSEVIRIIAIAHQKRKPGFWKGRKT